MKKSFFKSSAFIVIVLHIIAVFAVVFFAAEEGVLGKKMKELTVVLVPKQKVEKVEPKQEPARIESAPAPVVNPVQNAAPPKAIINDQPAIAPAANVLPAFNFDDGAKQVETINNPIDLYKSYIEYIIHENWKPPENLDESFLTRISIQLDKKGKIVDYKVESSIGDLIWQKSIDDVLKSIKQFKAPPTNFPMIFEIRFDTTL